MVETLLIINMVLIALTSLINYRTAQLNYKLAQQKKDAERTSAQHPSQNVE